MTQYLRGQLSREALTMVAHVVALLVLVTWLRPVMGARIPGHLYRGESVVLELIVADIDMIGTAVAQRRLRVPRLLFLLLPTLLLYFSKRKPTWDSWRHGRSLRWLIMMWLIPLAWAGSTFGYNIYMGQGHFLDRLLLVMLTALSWRSPLAVPFAARLAFVMMKEVSYPIVHDNFDFLSINELLFVFTVFVWVSFKKSFQPKHFLMVALGHWAAYYFWAGMAKYNLDHDWGWVTENHLSNLSVGGYVRGYLGFLSEESFLAFNDVVRGFDMHLAIFTVVAEFGALVMFHLHRNTIRAWAIICFCLNGGILALTGICFWKWMWANAALFVFASRPGGREIVNAMCRHRLATALAVGSIFYANHRIWYNPKTHVSWWDTRLTENYEIYAIGDSGKRYHVHPKWLEPNEMHWIMGSLCYATNERSVSGIYATGSRRVARVLEEAKVPEDALKLVRRGRSCRNPERQKLEFDDYMKRYFSFTNRHGKPHRWLTWIGRPNHLVTMRQGEFYDLEEPVKQVDLHRELVFHFQGKLHRMDERRVHSVQVPR